MSPKLTMQEDIVTKVDFCCLRVKLLLPRTGGKLIKFTVCSTLEESRENHVLLSNRLDILIEGARRTGLTIDFLYDISIGLSKSSLRKVIGNASSIPSYMKSSDSPNFARITRDASRETRL